MQSNASLDSMRIGIFNRYWSTLGGGERHVGSLIDELFEGTEVDLISTSDFEVSMLRSRLGLKLRHVNKVIWPNLPDASLTPWTCEYDFFINSTYRSYLHSLARESLYFIFFPQALKKGATVRLPVDEIVVTGSYAEEADGLAWTYPSSRWRFGRFRRRFTIPLRRANPHLFSAADIEVRSRFCEVESITLDEIILRGVKPFLSEVMIAVPQYEPGELDHRCLGLPIDVIQMRARNNLRPRSLKLQAVQGENFASSYDVFVANSEFTAKWTRKRWRVKPLRMTPKIDVPLKLDVQKEKMIVSVGRFFAQQDGSHNKKQDVLIEAFKTLHDRGGGRRGWRLVLAGSTGAKPEDVRYLNKLRLAAGNYPIAFYLDMERNDLLQLYARAAIFWQATGYDESLAHPERFEHFGITTCEAMGYGCIPVVFDAAGQKEIVDSPSLGYRFKTREQLVVQTERLISLCDRGMLGEQARHVSESVERYQKFDEKALRILRSRLDRLGTKLRARSESRLDMGA